MTAFILIHEHSETECASAFAAWLGVPSELRRRPAWAGCMHGEHRVFWRVEAESAAAALAMLPEFVAARATATPVRRVTVP